jgi:hypothetical protein
MRVSPITLVIFIVLSVFCLVFCYAFYSVGETHQKELEDATAKLQAKEKTLQAQLKDFNELLAATGYNLTELKDVAGQPARKLDEILKQKLDARDALVKEIGKEVTDIDAQGSSLYLQKTIKDALDGGATPPELRGTLVGDIIDALRDADKNLKEHEEVIKKGEGDIKGLNTSIEQKDAETKRTIAEWDQKIKAAWEARRVARQKLLDDRKVWAAEEVELAGRLGQDKAILSKVDARAAAQADMASPADGKIIDYDWKKKCGTINLGAKDGIKAGYQFDVFRRYPGADTVDRRTYLAKVTVIDVQPNVSLVAQVPSEYDKGGQTLATGDFVTSRIYGTSSGKRYYIAGYFPRGSEYQSQGLAGLIKRSGGVIQNELTLDVDYVVVGVLDEGGMPDWSPEAKAAIAKAKADYDLARRYDLEILTVDKLLSLISRK